MNEEEELKKAREQYDAENQEIYDEETKANEELRRRAEEQKRIDEALKERPGETAIQRRRRLSNELGVDYKGKKVLPPDADIQTEGNLKGQPKPEDIFGEGYKGKPTYLDDPKDEEDNNPRFAESISFEIGANVVLDKVTGGLLVAPVPGARVLYGLANVGGSGIINYLAQRIRGTEFSLGELATASGLSLIPGGTQAKTLKGAIGKSTVKGAGLGGLQVTSESLIDTGELPDAETFATGTLFGGVAGGFFQSVAEKDQIGYALRAMRNTINNKPAGADFAAIGTVGAAKRQPPNFSTTGTFGRARYYESPQQTQKIASELVNTWGMKDLTFDFDQYEIMRPKVVNSASRLFGELFESVPYTKINFNTMQQAKVPALQKKYSSIVEALGFPARKFQLHHTVPIKGSLPGYDGLAFGSDEWWDVTEILFRNMLRPGNDAFNLTALVGGNKPTTVLQNGIPTRFPTPHSVTHKFLDAKIGPSGENFWTKEVRKKMKNDFEYRKEKWQEYAELVKQSQDITNQAEFTFRDLYEDIPADQLDDELDLLVERLVDLDDRGLLKKTTVDDNYQVPQMKDIVTEIGEEMRESDLDTMLDTVTGRQQKQREFVRKRLIEEIELRKLNDMTVPEQMAKLQELTGMSIDDIQLLIQTQPGFDIAKFIFDNQ